MKVIRIEHWRCGEPDKSEYFTAPDDMSPEDIGKAIKAAEAKYNQLLKDYDQDNPPADPNNYYDINQIKEDSLTIKQVKELKKAQSDAEHARRERKWALAGSFNKHLADQGIYNVREIEFPEELDFTVSWGHRHGETLDY